MYVCNTIWCKFALFTEIYECLTAREDYSRNAIHLLAAYYFVLKNYIKKKIKYAFLIWTYELYEDGPINIQLLQNELIVV